MLEIIQIYYAFFSLLDSLTNTVSVAQLEDEAWGLMINAIYVWCGSGEPGRSSSILQKFTYAVCLHLWCIRTMCLF